MGSPSKPELRKFGLSVGAAFAALGAVSRWRGHELPPNILWTLAALLAVPGLLAPALLAPVQRAWMGFAMALGQVNTRIILGVLFYLAVTPIGFATRLFRDPMNRSLKNSSDSQWVKRDRKPAELARYERQF